MGDYSTAKLEIWLTGCAQRQVESRNYEIRKNILKYDDVMTEQREKVYDERRRVLDGEDLEPQMEHFRSQTVSGIVDAATAEGRPDQWDLESLWAELGRLFPVSLKGRRKLEPFDCIEAPCQ